MNEEIQEVWDKIIENKKKSRKILIELPWREKFKRLDAMMERQDHLRKFKLQDKQIPLETYKQPENS